MSQERKRSSGLRGTASMRWMSSAYLQLLDATILHLQELKERGARFVPVAPETLAALSQKSAVAPPRGLTRPAAPPLPRVEKPTLQTAVFTSNPGEPRPPIAPPLGLGLAEEQRPTAVAPVLGPALSAEAKAAAFEELRQRARACVKCPHLATSRKTVVFGVGSLDAELMFVGEAPGADEDEQGEPFVGKAGQLLTRIIQTMGLTREQVYIGNILKCRPDTPGQSAGNRKPTPEEMNTCIPYLHEQIDLIRPKVIVALGATAVEGLLGKTLGITKLRGNWRTYRGTPLMPTYHPAYLLRNQALSEKRRVWEDMLKVMEKLSLPINDKQRGYFLKGP
jgi:uracil-DNA glycosylase